MTTEEQEEKIIKDLEATRRIVFQSNLLLRRIEAASGKLLNGDRIKNGNRPQPS